MQYLVSVIDDTPNSAHRARYF